MNTKKEENVPASKTLFWMPHFRWRRYRLKTKLNWVLPGGAAASRTPTESQSEERPEGMKVVWKAAWQLGETARWRPRRNPNIRQRRKKNVSLSAKFLPCCRLDCQSRLVTRWLDLRSPFYPKSQQLIVYLNIYISIFSAGVLSRVSVSVVAPSFGSLK